MRTMAIGLTLLAAGLFALPAAWAQTPQEKEQADLAKALKGTTFPLQRGLTASAKAGKPISAKYEMDEGKLQLSVYTMKGEKFSEVIVDHRPGRSPRLSPLPKGTISRMPRHKVKPWPRPSVPSRQLLRRPQKRTRAIGS